MSYSKYIVHFEDETAQSVIDAAEAHIVARGMLHCTAMCVRPDSVTECVISDTPFDRRLHC